MGLDHPTELSVVDDSLNATIMSYNDSETYTLGGKAADGLDGLAPPVSEHRALAELRALVEIAEFTNEGYVRHAAFLHLL